MRYSRGSEHCNSAGAFGELIRRKIKGRTEIRARRASIRRGLRSNKTTVFFRSGKDRRRENLETEPEVWKTKEIAYLGQNGADVWRRNRNCTRYLKKRKDDRQGGIKERKAKSSMAS